MENPYRLISNPNTVPQQHIADVEVPVIVKSHSHREDRARHEGNIKRRSNQRRQSAMGKALFKGAAVSAAAAAVVGAHKLAEGPAMPQPNAKTGHNRIYTAKPGDTEWGIAQRAYPNIDPRIVVSYINEQEPAPDRKEHLVRPGDKFVFAHDAEIGKSVPMALEAKSLDMPPMP